MACVDFKKHLLGKAFLKLRWPLPPAPNDFSTAFIFISIVFGWLTTFLKQQQNPCLLYPAASVFCCPNRRCSRICGRCGTMEPTCGGGDQPWQWKLLRWSGKLWLCWGVCLQHTAVSCLESVVQNKLKRMNKQQKTLASFEIKNIKSTQ